MRIDDAISPEVITKLQSAMEKWSTSLDNYRTAKLWLLYMHLVEILRAFILSARTGNWKMYLQSLHEMLPYLAASGHNNYVKSLTLYLTYMEKLEDIHPHVYVG